jgi:hypothetical protein
MLARLAAEYQVRDTITSAPPRILREEMALAEDAVTGISIVDTALAIWEEWYRESGHAPCWSRFRPFDHPSLLPNVMLYERIENRYRCAVVGDEAFTNLPVRLARRFLDEAMPAENLADITMRLTAALSIERPNFVEKTMAWKAGHDLKCYCALQLPFRAPPGGNPRKRRQSASLAP